MDTKAEREEETMEAAGMGTGSWHGEVQEGRVANCKVKHEFEH